MNNTINFTLPDSAPSNLSYWVEETPVEALAILVSSLVTRIFSQSVAITLLGIGLSMAATSLVIKAVNMYNPQAIVSLTKRVCIFNQTHPTAQIVSAVFAFAISFISKAFGLFAGAFIGGFSAIILDVERVKLMQNANRATQ